MSKILDRFSLLQKLALLLAAFAVCVAAITFSAFTTINEVRIGGETARGLENDNVLLADIMPPPMFIIEARETVALMRQAKDHISLHRESERLLALQASFRERIQYWNDNPHEPPQMALINGEITKHGEAYFKRALGSYLNALRSADPQLIENEFAALQQDAVAQQAAVVELIKVVSDVYQSSMADAKQMVSDDIRNTLMIIAVSALVFVLIFFLVLHSIRQQVGGEPAHAREALYRALAGDTGIRLKLAEGDNSSLMAAIAQVINLTIESSRVRIALDNCSTNVMIADNDRTIIYMNQTVKAMLQNAEADLRKELPGFNASKLLGTPIDGFHKHPEHQAQLLGTFTSTYKANIKVGGRTFSLTANPVIDQSGQRLGSVVEWRDTTEELIAQEKAERLAADNARIRNALDNCSTNVMIADNDRNIIYMNNSITAMLQNAEADLRKALPGFNASQLLGASIDAFHKNPEHQKQLLATFTSTHKANIKVGGRTFSLTANPVIDQSGQRIGSVVEWRDTTEELIAQEKAERLAADNARIRNALDNCSTNVMIADNDRTIIYMNKSVSAMLQNAEADLRKALPNFNASRLMGASIDGFHKNPEHQKRLLATFTSAYQTQIEVGGRTFSLVANPVMGGNGERLGSVVEWNDRTAEVEVEREVATLVDAASAGNFSLRINEAGKSGFLLKLASGLNQLVTTADKGLNDVVRVLGALAKGDLTQQIEDDYEGTFGQLKDFSNETTSSLSRMLAQIRQAADAIYTAAGEISAGNSDLSSRTEQQASSLEETASSMEEMTSTVKLNAENVRQANAVSANASAVATDGGVLVEQVVSTMSSINESARKISDIISLIDGIAFQTNILALNAAVEAARAGEQGRGFAVVAAEVRSLAQRSTAAAKEIKSLISDSVEKVDKGNVLVAQAGKTMREIVTSIKRVTDIMTDIAAASAEQSTGIAEINTAVSQMEQMTQQNAALVEEAAASAESLLDQASVMSQAVAVFKFEQSQSQPNPVSRPALPRPASKAKSGARVAAKGRLAKSDDDEWEAF